MKFDLTAALHGARVTTTDGRQVVGLVHQPNKQLALAGFIRSRDGTYSENTWTLDGFFHTTKNPNESDLICHLELSPWFNMDVVPGQYDGVALDKDGDPQNHIIVYRFFDNLINKTWEGEWEHRGTATHWSNPGPTPRDYMNIIEKCDIRLKAGDFLLESDWVIDDAKFKQVKEVPWAKAKAGEKHDGKFTAVRLSEGAAL